MPMSISCSEVDLSATTTGASGKVRNVGLDLLRVVMILWIVGIWHLLGFTATYRGYKTVLTNELTTVALAVFVYVSGYLVSCNHSFTSIKSVADYFIKRALRLYALFCIAALVYWLLNVDDFYVLIRGVTLVAMLIPRPPWTLWFVVMILNFSIIAPALVLMSKRKFYAVLSLAVGIALLAAWNVFVCKVDGRLVMYFPVFWLGVLAVRGGFHGKLVQGSGRTLILSAIACAAYLLFRRSGESAFVVSLLKAPFLMLVSILTVSQAERLKAGKRASRIIAYLAWISFALYLFHRPVFLMFTRTYMPSQFIFQLAYLYLVVLPVCVLTAIIVQLIYECGERMVRSFCLKLFRGV